MTTQKTRDELRRLLRVAEEAEAAAAAAVPQETGTYSDRFAGEPEMRAVDIAEENLQAAAAAALPLLLDQVEMQAGLLKLAGKLSILARMVGMASALELSHLVAQMMAVRLAYDDAVIAATTSGASSG